jgi:CRISPR/Cas system-associated endonuclease/helicase Cas3
MQPEVRCVELFKSISFDELCKIIDEYKQNGYDNFYLEVNNNYYPNEDDGITNAEIKLSGTKIYTEQELYNYYKKFVPDVQNLIQQRKKREKESKKTREENEKKEYERLKKKFCK